jgi:hypothetical protein
MKIVITLLLLGLTLSACAPPPPTNKSTDVGDLKLVETKLGPNFWREYDEEARVVCWVVYSSSGLGISCLPTGDTSLW